MLVEQKHEDAVEELIVLNNGCVCCTIRGDLQKTLQDLAARQKDGKVKLDGVLIELTGAADPAPVVQTFFMDDAVKKAFYIDNVITLVDAKHCLEKLDENVGTASAQIAFSSTVLLNKIDLVDEEEIVMCEKRIAEINAPVEIIRCKNAHVPLDKLFNVKAFHLSKVLDEQFMDEDRFHSRYKPKMDSSISNVGVQFEGALNMCKFQRFLEGLISDEEVAKDFLRIKGVLSIKGSGRRFVLQCVHMFQKADFNKPWGKQKRENRIIFIGRNMQQRRQMLTDGVMACVAKPLRFDVGADVLAVLDQGSLPGKVVKHWEDLNAYRIRLEDGREAYAPLDDDEFIKEPVPTDGEPASAPVAEVPALVDGAPAKEQEAPEDDEHARGTKRRIEE